MPQDSRPQLSFLSCAHCVVEMRFYADSSKYITFFCCIFCLNPLLSINMNFIVPMPDAIKLPATSVTPNDDAGRMFVKRLSKEHMWWVAQLSVPNSVASLWNDMVLFEVDFLLTLCSTRGFISLLVITANTLHLLCL